MRAYTRLFLIYAILNMGPPIQSQVKRITTKFWGRLIWRTSRQLWKVRSFLMRWRQQIL